MTDEENYARRLQSEQEYGKEVSLSHEKLLKASKAAATPKRKWQDRMRVARKGVRPAFDY